MSGGNTDGNSDWLSFKIVLMFLFHFDAKRKRLLLLCVPSVMFRYKPKIKDFWHLINMRKQKPMFGYVKI